MELNFLGRGASANVKEGNTSAYFIDNGDLFLIASGETIDKIYIDTTEKDQVHLDINTINSIVPEELKSHVYCMHFKDDEIIKLAQSLGFNIVETIEGRKKELIKSLKEEFNK